MSIFNFFKQKPQVNEVSFTSNDERHKPYHAEVNMPPVELFIDSKEPDRISKPDMPSANRINQFLSRNFLTVGINDGFEYHSVETLGKVKMKILAEFQLIMDQEIQVKKEKLLEMRQLIIDVKYLSESAKEKLELTIEELNASVQLLQTQKELSALEEGWVMNAIHAYHQGFIQGLNDYIEGEHFLHSVKNF